MMTTAALGLGTSPSPLALSPLLSSEIPEHWPHLDAGFFFNSPYHCSPQKQHTDPMTACRHTCSFYSERQSAPPSAAILPLLPICGSLELDMGQAHQKF